MIPEILLTLGRGPTMIRPLATTPQIFTVGQAQLSEVAMQYREEVVPSGGSYWALLIPVIAVALAGLVYAIYNRQPTVTNTPIGLLHEICREHRIGRGPRQLMEKIARAAELNQPAELALSVEHFEAAVESASRRIRYDRRAQSYLGLLRRRLFAG